MNTSRFTDRAKQSLLVANQIAQSHGRECVKSEHLLLALLSDRKSRAFQIVSGLGVPVDEVRGALIRSVNPDGEFSFGTHSPITTKLPISRNCEKCLHIAVEETGRLNLNYVGVEHLLLGVIANTDSMASEILHEDFGVSVEDVN